MAFFRRLFNKCKESESMFPGKRLNIDQIIALNDSTDMIFELSYGIADKIQKKGFESLSHPEQVLYYVYWLEAEINNGGFEQYFGNSSGDYALDTPAALAEIGAHHTANLVKRAINLFPDGSPSRDREQRNDQLDSLDEDALAEFENLDSEFYEYLDPLGELQVEYMIKNKDQIRV